MSKRVKRTASAALLVLLVVNLLSSLGWFLYTYLVPTPAREQLATTHADLVGPWEGAIRLDIEPDGQVLYHGQNIHYGGKAWRFENDGFRLWVFPWFPARFQLAGRPEMREGGTFLNVDGHELRFVGRAPLPGLRANTIPSASGDPR